MPPDTPPLYVSCVDGKPVTRFRIGGRGGRTLGDPIGADRGEGRAWIYDPARVVRIPPDELAVFGRIYERAIADGDLTRRTVEDFEQQNNRGADASPNGSAPPAGGTDT